MHFIDSKDSTIAFGNLNLGEKAGLFIQTKGDDLILGKSNCEELPQFVSKSDDLTAKSDYLVMEHRSKSDLIQF
ncbi:MAG TPA: hypothetical protein IGS17_14365 [Oscillatoriales cyanobacterium M59_W2019_021]|nr:hypothetical protein [Oscillatoriales cyanobacterium M4454_W2019_049]HIK52087.1 hypothetical protein [Oscillatoriales cyanobacterium M59_W2019_021]